MNRTPITCDLSSCHQHVPGIFHGRTDLITNDEVLELMASPEQSASVLQRASEEGFLQRQLPDQHKELELIKCSCRRYGCVGGSVAQWLGRWP